MLAQLQEANRSEQTVATELIVWFLAELKQNLEQPLQRDELCFHRNSARFYVENVQEPSNLNCGTIYVRIHNGTRRNMEGNYMRVCETKSSFRFASKWK